MVEGQFPIVPNLSQQLVRLGQGGLLVGRGYRKCITKRYAVSRGSVAGDFLVVWGRLSLVGVNLLATSFIFVHPQFWTHFEVCNREVNCSSSRRTASYIAGVGVTSAPSTSVAKPLNVPFSSANWSAAASPCCFAAW